MPTPTIKSSQTQTPEPKLNVTVSNSIYGLKDILETLSSQKDIFNIQESPNKKYVAYMHSDTGIAFDKLTLHLWHVGDPQPLETSKIEEETVGDVLWSPDDRTVVYGKGNNNEGLGKIFMWRVGEEKPSQIVPNDTGYPIGNFSWSPNSEFFTIRIAVAPESGGYLIRVDDQKTTRILCFMVPFFSADSKFLLFTGEENIQSTYKVAGSGVSLNISLMDLNTLKTSVLIPSTDKINYLSLGWAGSNKLMYRKYDFSTNMDEILEVLRWN